MKLVLVEWLDSHSGRNWRSFDEIREECQPLYCRSVGWLLAKKNGYMILVPHIYDEKNSGIVPQGCGDIAIPTKSIIGTTVLRDVRRKP